MVPDLHKETSTNIPETDDLLCREAATGQAWRLLWLKRKINISKFIAENAQVHKNILHVIFRSYYMKIKPFFSPELFQNFKHVFNVREVSG
jgi:hypothetical protein